MKKLFLFLFFAHLFAAHGYAQPDSSSIRLVKTLKGDYADFTIDNLGNLYVLNRQNSLKKISQNGDSMGVYNDVRRYGKAYTIDASNPLKLLLYYKDFGTIVVLDRFLNERSSINLRQNNIFQVRALCQSYDNNVWLYDEQEAKLRKMNEQGNILEEFADFRQFTDTVPSPVKLVDYDRLLYLYDPASGLYIFDYFGTLKNRLPLRGWQDFQVVGNKVFGRINTVLQQYQPGSLSIQEYPLGSLLAGVDKIVISTNRLYCLKAGSVQVYSF